MIRVTTASRLHCGLLSLGGDGTCKPDRHGDPVLPMRRFGSVGFMIEKPGGCVSVAPAVEWSAQGPLAERALAFARRFAQSIDSALSPHRLIVEQSPPEHVGLGVGTQLGLAVARALAASAGLAMSAAELARRVERGQRSGLGVHGFEEGGFLVDGGKRAAGGVAPLVARLPFPETWRVLLVIPPSESGLHGQREQEAFVRLTTMVDTSSRTDALCRLVLLDLLPALMESDLPAFGEALFEFNTRAGEAFAAVQGGTYASPLVAEVVAFLRAQGIAGVGQSSWGPAVFAVSDREDYLRHLIDRVRERFALPPTALLVTSGCNRGAVMS